MLSYDLPESRTYAHRHYTLVPLAGCEYADALLTIQQGLRGPRGRLPEVETYLVQVEPDAADPAGPHRGLFVSFLLEKDREPPEPGETGPYRVWLSLARRGVRSCTCKGYLCTNGCKHADALGHAVRVCGWGVLQAAAESGAGA